MSEPLLRRLLALWRVSTPGRVSVGTLRFEEKRNLKRSSGIVADPLYGTSSTN